MKIPSRDEQRRIVINSLHYQCGLEFNRNVIAPILGLTAEGAASMLSSMANDGLLSKRHVKQGNKQFIQYCKPVSRLARVKWRKFTDKQLGIETCAY